MYDTLNETLTWHTTERYTNYSKRSILWLFVFSQSLSLLFHLPWRVVTNHPGFSWIIQGLVVWSRDPGIAAKIQGKWDMGHIQSSLPWGLVSLYLRSRWIMIHLVLPATILSQSIFSRLQSQPLAGVSKNIKTLHNQVLCFYSSYICLCHCFCVCVHFKHLSASYPGILPKYPGKMGPISRVVFLRGW